MRLSPLLLQGYFHYRYRFQHKLQTGRAGGAAARRWPCVEPGALLRCVVPVPGEGRPGPSRREGAEPPFILLRCQRGGCFWDGAGAEAHRALWTSPAYILQCFTFPIPTVSALSICVSFPVPGKAGTGDQQQRIKAPSCTGPCFCSSPALPQGHRSHPRLPVFQVQTGRRAGGFLKTALPANPDIRGGKTEKPFYSKMLSISNSSPFPGLNALHKLIKSLSTRGGCVCLPASTGLFRRWFVLMSPEGFTGRVLESMGEIEPAKQL